MQLCVRPMVVPRQRRAELQLLRSSSVTPFALTPYVTLHNMPSYASIFIRSGVFMVALAGMSNSIVLPATVALEPGTHLAELIRDVFVTHGPGNGTAANKTPATANASSNVGDAERENTYAGRYLTCLCC